MNDKAPRWGKFRAFCKYTARATNKGREDGREGFLKKMTIRTKG